MILKPRGLKPAMDDETLNDLIAQLSAIADEKGIKNLATLLTEVDAAKIFFAWASNQDASQAEMNEGGLDDGLMEKLGMLSSMSNLDYFPEDSEDGKSGFRDLLDTLQVNGHLREFSWLVYAQAADQNQTIKEFISDSRNRNSLVSNLLTIMGDETEVHPASSVMEGHLPSIEDELHNVVHPVEFSSMASLLPTKPNNNKHSRERIIVPFLR
jgi:hypothetical protein